MSESGLLTLNPRGKAIWRCRVAIDDWVPEEPFSLIRLSHDTIWSDPEAVPVFGGTIEVAGDSQKNTDAVPEDASSAGSGDRQAVVPDSASAFHD